MPLTADEQQWWFDILQGGNLDDLRTLHAKGADVTARFDKQPGIVIAAIAGHTEAVRFLLDHGAEIDDREEDVKQTALMSAADGGNNALIKLLLDYGADVNAIDLNGLTAFDYAKSHRKVPDYRDAMRLLWQHRGRPGQARTVLVTGAGFSRAYFDHAPVLIDAFKVRDELLPKYRNFPAAREVLESELRRQAQLDLQEGMEDKGRINLERLMTRLVGGMPYDAAHDAKAIFGSLLADLRRVFVEEIGKARKGTNPYLELQQLASYCLLRKVNYITFNYDDLFDEALENVSPSTNDVRQWEWQRSSGYGYFCRPSGELIGLGSESSFFTETKIQVLKLHGSMNWRTRRGAAQPYGVNDFFHHEQWTVRNRAAEQQGGASSALIYGLDPREYNRRIEQHLEPEPFIIPPVLTKSDLVAQPLLRLLWSQAFDVLQNADQVVFVGYSLPVTDIAVSYLFGEAFSDLYPLTPLITVVDYETKGDHKKRNELINAYRKVFPGLSEECVRFDGAMEWAKQFREEDKANLL